MTNEDEKKYLFTYMEVKALIYLCIARNTLFLTSDESEKLIRKGRTERQLREYLEAEIFDKIVDEHFMRKMEKGEVLKDDLGSKT